MFRAIGDQPSLGESLLPDEVLQLPEELARLAEGRSERGDAAGALKAFEELARLEPGNAEFHSKAAAARTLITSGR